MGRNERVGRIRCTKALHYCPSSTSSMCEGRREVCPPPTGMMKLLATSSKLLRAMETDKSDFPEKQEYKHDGQFL